MRDPSYAFDDSDSDSSDSITSSYSYDSSSGSSSSYSDSSSSGSSIHRRHGRRRSRSRSPILKSDDDSYSAHRRFRTEGVLGDCSGVASFVCSNPAQPVLGDLSMSPTHVSHTRDTKGMPHALDKPVGDWTCGVCSNINSQQRDDCYRCGCSFTESLLATPSYEVCVTRFPSGVSVSAVEKAIRRTVPEGCVPYVVADRSKSLVFAQFASVEDATRYLVSRRCELEVTTADGGDGQRTRLGFSLDPHPRPKEEDVAAEAARVAASAEREKREDALVTAGVPRFLWPHTWNPPTSFPSVDKHKTFLGTMSSHWDHLSDDQKRYYEAEVKKALMQAVSPPELTVLKEAETPQVAARAANMSNPSIKTTTESPAAAPSVSPSSPVTASPPSSLTEDLPQKSAGKTSHALDGLKKRLAERKSALKKADASSGSGAATGSPPASPGSTTTSLKAGGGTRGGVSSPASGGELSAAPSCRFAQMQMCGGFPVPLQYTTLADIPQSVELARVPMNVCERLLPPALLQAARMQFR
ncbi:hypothetical protein ABL78_6270 [Leptomonas seymouri]|uniref:RanBP2-type domain-containing protein n=1 Tax=Leptomonas seymouri TaxID=5684 RepID=A0A0N0P3Y5_LEPSE|nr:hypothetical protein ABL78_6270 [Leptomonas seymouri]|eukprot:KPI84676.1 hypothetical protein ABL78_6270 [Leptomonas seymouri]